MILSLASSRGFNKGRSLRSRPRWADAAGVTCPNCRHPFSFPECLAVWFPTRVPCPKCQATATLGILGWGAFASVNLAGTWIVVWAFFQIGSGTLAPNRAVALILLVAVLAPFVWFGTLKILTARPLRS